MTEYSCNSTNEEIISEICTNGSDTSCVECILPYNDITLKLRYVCGAWMTFTAIFGILGNLTTLVSIPFAASRKLYGFDRNFTSTTIFILHLSFIELCWCLLGAIPFSYQLLAREWPFGTLLCKAHAIFVQIISPTEAAALACISITRCLGLIKGRHWRTFSYKKCNLILLLITPWILSLPTLFPYFVKSSGVDVGWSCTFGQCGTISSCQQSTSTGACIHESTWFADFIPWYMFLIVLSSIIIIIICYVFIDRNARMSSVYLKKEGKMSSQIQKRDLKMLKTILLLILSHGICNLPLRFALFYNYIIPGAHLTLRIWYGLMMIYESQFALNFFIYAGSNEQYRKAYLYYWKYLTCQGAKINNVNNSGKARLSFPLFFTPDRDVLIECHPQFLQSGETAKYKRTLQPRLCNC